MIRGTIFGHAEHFPTISDRFHDPTQNRIFFSSLGLPLYEKNTILGRIMELVENSWKTFSMAENGTPYHFFDKSIKNNDLKKADKMQKIGFLHIFSVKKWL